MSLSLSLYTIGFIGFVLNRKHILLALLSIELMLLSVTLLILFGSLNFSDITGIGIGIFSIVIAGAETAILRLNMYCRTDALSVVRSQEKTKRLSWHASPNERRYEVQVNIRIECTATQKRSFQSYILICGAKAKWYFKTGSFSLYLRQSKDIGQYKRVAIIWWHNSYLDLLGYSRTVTHYTNIIFMKFLKISYAIQKLGNLGQGVVSIGEGAANAVLQLSCKTTSLCQAEKQDIESRYGGKIGEKANALGNASDISGKLSNTYVECSRALELSRLNSEERRQNSQVFKSEQTNNAFLKAKDMENSKVEESRKSWSNGEIFNNNNIETKVFNEQCKLAALASRYGLRHKLVQRRMLTLIKSFNFRYYAVEKVTSNSGSKTPGVDGFIIKSKKEFITMVELITNIKDYKCSPLRWIYISKSGNKSENKQRPLGIPTIKDRCMQQLVTLVLEPLVEINSDSESYGYRKYRSAKNAIGSIRSLLKSESHQERKWILDADIEGFFENINHDWLLKNTPLPSALLKLLKDWLKSGVIYKQEHVLIEKGTPQGGIISPILVNMTLNGLESIVKNSISPLTSSIAMRIVIKNKDGNNVWLSLFVRSVRYADDFIIFARSKFIIKTYIKPAVEDFLSERGLKLSTEKTSIYCIQDRELKFLGFVFKYRSDWRVKYGMIKERLGMKKGIALYPDKEKVKEVIRKIKDVINRSESLSAYELITKLNPIIREWNNYFNIGNSSKFRNKVEHIIFNAVKKWAIKKHRRWGIRRISKTYFICDPKYKNRKWNFHGFTFNKSRYTNNENGKTIYLQSVWDSNTMASNQFNLTNEFKKIHAYHEDSIKLWKFNLKNKIRSMTMFSSLKEKLFKKQKGICPLCNFEIDFELDKNLLQIDHIQPISEGGSKNFIKNMRLVHTRCHQKHHD